MQSWANNADIPPMPIPKTLIIFMTLLSREESCVSQGEVCPNEIGGNDGRQFSEKILASHFVPLKLEG